MLLALVSVPDFNGAANLVEQAGKTALTLSAFFVLVVAVVVLWFFGKEKLWVRIGSLFVIIACMIFVVFVLVLPARKIDPPGPEPGPHPDRPERPAVQPTQCTGKHVEVFSPASYPGFLQKNPNGTLVDLGDGGGGTRLYKWRVSWTAPAKVTSVHCSAGRNEIVRAENSTGSIAECVGSINGGGDSITMHITWDGPCDAQPGDGSQGKGQTVGLSASGANNCTNVVAGRDAKVNCPSSENLNVGGKTAPNH